MRYVWEVTYDQTFAKRANGHVINRVKTYTDRIRAGDSIDSACEAVKKKNINTHLSEDPDFKTRSFKFTKVTQITHIDY